MSTYFKAINFIFFYIFLAYPASAVLPDSSDAHYKVSYLPETDFGDHEYAEYQDDDMKNRELIMQAKSPLNDVIPTEASRTFFNEHDSLDPNIKWDSKWPDKVTFGQTSAVSIDPNGNVVIFHRGTRVWGYGSFDQDNRFNKQLGPIKEKTIVLLDKNGKKILEWGENMFFLPHGLTVDSLGNYWITDVAMHQVFKFDAKDLEAYKKQQNKTIKNAYDNDDLYKDSIPKPSIILGQAFVPGNDDKHFCKPTAVAVHSNGDFFVSDGYCNARIIKYNSKGEQILQWGRRWDTAGLQPNAFAIPHALALAEELNYILVADREHGRILCFYSDSGQFHREYKDPRIGTKLFSIAYARNKIYLVNGRDAYQNNNFHVRGFVLDINSGNIISQFGPNGNMKEPHDIAVTNDGYEIYVTDLNVKKVYKFIQGYNATQTENSNGSSLSNPEVSPLSKSSNEAVALLLSVFIITIILITICLLLAVSLARCRKRGCLLTTRKRMDWDTDRNENFKLSAVLGKRINHKFRFFERRPNTRDFNKLSNEPETSDDESCENNLTNII